MSWSRRLGLPVHRFLMPLSFASILGGTCSLMGTSTNLVVYGPGGYRFGDFARLGALLNPLVGAVALTLIPVFWPF